MRIVKWFQRHRKPRGNGKFEGTTLYIPAEAIRYSGLDPARAVTLEVSEGAITLRQNDSDKTED